MSSISGTRNPWSVQVKLAAPTVNADSVPSPEARPNGSANWGVTGCSPVAEARSSWNR